MLTLDAMEVKSVKVKPIGLRRCRQCGELYGRTYYGTPYDRIFLEAVTVTCLCKGIVCHWCKKNAIHRPISNYFDEETGTIWHVPHFGFLARCRECRARRDGDNA